MDNPAEALRYLGLALATFGGLAVAILQLVWGGRLDSIRILADRDFWARQGKWLLITLAVFSASPIVLSSGLFLGWFPQDMIDSVLLAGVVYAGCFAGCLWAMIRMVTPHEIMRRAWRRVLEVRLPPAENRRKLLLHPDTDALYQQLSFWIRQSEEALVDECFTVGLRELETRTWEGVRDRVAVNIYIEVLIQIHIQSEEHEMWSTAMGLLGFGCNAKLFECDEDPMAAAAWLEERAFFFVQMRYLISFSECIGLIGKKLAQMMKRPDQIGIASKRVFALAEAGRALAHERIPNQVGITMIHLAERLRQLIPVRPQNEDDLKEAVSAIHYLHDDIDSFLERWIASTYAGITDLFVTSFGQIMTVAMLVESPDGVAKRFASLRRRLHRSGNPEAFRSAMWTGNRLLDLALEKRRDQPAYALVSLGALIELWMRILVLKPFEITSFLTGLMREAVRECIDRLPSEAVPSCSRQAGQLARWLATDLYQLLHSRPQLLQDEAFPTMLDYTMKHIFVFGGFALESRELSWADNSTRAGVSYIFNTLAARGEHYDIQGMSKFVSEMLSFDRQIEDSDSIARGVIALFIFQ